MVKVVLKASVDKFFIVEYLVLGDNHKNSVDEDEDG